MNDVPDRTRQIFFEVFERNPRQGPGNRESTERALALCAALPKAPRIIDLGCGAGAQTLDLAEMTTGEIIAVDRHAPLIDLLRAKLRAGDLEGRVHARVGDMADVGEPPSSFDLVWSEGALYNLGLARALPLAHDLLRPGGYVAFSDAIWISEAPPEDLVATFEEEYPTMGRLEDALGAIEAAGLDVIEHFRLPDEAWWTDFYTPMLATIEALRSRYADDGEALAALDLVAAEPGSHPENARHIAYEFFVARRPA